MPAPSEIPVVLTLLDDTDNVFLQEWVRSEVPHLGQIVDYHVDIVVNPRIDLPPQVALTVFTAAGQVRRIIDLDDALRELARVMLQ